MDTDLDTLATALYVTTDDLLRAHPERVPARPRGGSFEPLTSDAEMVTLAVMQSVLGYPSEAHWLRYAHKHLRPLFPVLPLQLGYNKRPRKLAYYGRAFEADLDEVGIDLLRKARKGEKPRTGAQFFKPLPVRPLQRLVGARWHARDPPAQD